MEYIVNGLLILLLGTLYFFAIRYLFRKGTCAGCSSCKSHREVSSCFTVSEGCGDHGLEYMTGGRAIVLGPTGKNFAAGMSGGIAYVLDEDNDLYMRTNKSMVFSEEVTNKYDVLELKEMIKEHVTLTNSEKGKEILDHFSEYLPKFKKVIPYDYNRMQMAIVQMEEKGLNAEQAQIEAFYASTRA